MPASATSSAVGRVPKRGFLFQTCLVWLDFRFNFSLHLFNESTVVELRIPPAGCPALCNPPGCITQALISTQARCICIYICICTQARIEGGAFAFAVPLSVDRYLSHWTSICIPYPPGGISPSIQVPSIHPRLSYPTRTRQILESITSHCIAFAPPRNTTQYQWTLND